MKTQYDTQKSGGHSVYKKSYKKPFKSTYNKSEVGKMIETGVKIGLKKAYNKDKLLQCWVEVRFWSAQYQWWWQQRLQLVTRNKIGTNIKTIKNISIKI